MRGWGPKSGFALIELLVVLGMTALLAGLVLPSLGGARVGSRNKKCTTNMKLLSAASAAYASEFQDRIPAFSWQAGMRGDVLTGDAELADRVSRAEFDTVAVSAQAVDIFASPRRA